MAHPATVVATVLILLGGAFTLGLAVVAALAYRKSGNRRLLFVAAAFGMFTIKAAVTGWALQAHSIEHATLELVSSGFDFAIVLLLIIPLFR